MALYKELGENPREAESLWILLHRLQKVAMWNWHPASAAVAAVLCGFLAAAFLGVEGKDFD